jgi:nitrite reductase (NO-forming)
MAYHPQKYSIAAGSNETVKQRRPKGARRNAIRAAAALAIAGMLGGPFAAAHADNRAFTLTAARKRVSIGAGMTYDAWTYDGAVPGPVMRVKQGDDVSIHLDNSTSEAHGIEVMAAQISPSHFSGDPTAAVDYSFKANVPGVFDYQCSAIPMLDHVASGMYGMMIVEPSKGWPDGPAQEFTLVQGEYYGKPNDKGFVTADHEAMLAAQPSFIVFNGAVSRFGASNPIEIKTGKLVRIFFVNAGPNLVSTFHISGVIFSAVYQSGNPADPLHEVPSFSVAPGQGAVFEFTVNEPGDYRFSDIAGAHSYKGALGIIRASQ